MNAEMKSVKTEPAVVVQHSPLRDDIDLASIEIPASRQGRAVLRERIQREMLASDQEREILETCTAPSQVPTWVKRVTETLKGRAKALNPFRDFDKIGFSAINDGQNPWTDDAFSTDDLPAPLGYGIVAAVLGGLITGALTSNVPLAVGVGAFATSPLFLPSWIGRTAFNLITGAVAAIAAPASYVVAHLVDAEVRPGYRDAQAFLSDLQKSMLDNAERTEMIAARRAFLEQVVAKQQVVLAKIEEPIDKPYEVIKGDKSRLQARYLNSKWYTGLPGGKEDVER